ncbi:unnamed protein product [Heterobilharzia americana]|nr:unnamed protein product [Heterobilharzia americana]
MGMRTSDSNSSRIHFGSRAKPLVTEVKFRSGQQSGSRNSVGRASKRQPRRCWFESCRYRALHSTFSHYLVLKTQVSQAMATSDSQTENPVIVCLNLHTSTIIQLL